MRKRPNEQIPDHEQYAPIDDHVRDDDRIEYVFGKAFFGKFCCLTDYTDAHRWENARTTDTDHEQYAPIDDHVRDDDRSE